MGVNPERYGKWKTTHGKFVTLIFKKVKDENIRK